MIEELSVKFPGKPLVIRPVGRANILVGKNGIGKSHVLESVSTGMIIRHLNCNFDKKGIISDIPYLDRFEPSAFCIDEIENGIHHSNLIPLWQIVLRYLKRVPESQVFTTTHSWECLGAAVEVFKEMPKEFFIHRLEFVKGQLRAITIDFEIALTAIERNWEIR